MSESKITLAKWRHRFLAWLVDVVIVTSIIASVTFGFPDGPAAEEMAKGPDIEFEPPERLEVFAMAQTAVFWAYWAILESRNGQSVGKIVLRIRTVDLNGGRIGVRDSLIQSFGKSVLLPIDFIGGLIFTGKNRQRLFNKVSDTIVIRVE